MTEFDCDIKCNVDDVHSYVVKSDVTVLKAGFVGMIGGQIYQSYDIEILPQGIELVCLGFDIKRFFFEFNNN